MIKFPQPTPAELAEPKNIWISMNRFWWEILQGQIEWVPDPELWPDYTQDIDQAIHDLMTPDSSPMAELTVAKVYLSADQSVNSAAGTKVLLDTAEKLTGFTFSNNELTVLEDGYYSIKAVIAYSTGGGYRGGEIRVNNLAKGRSAYGNSGIAQVAINNYTLLHWEGDIGFEDIISLLAIHQSTGAINVVGGDTRTWLSAYRVG